jgi:arginine repressor
MHAKTKHGQMKIAIRTGLGLAHLFAVLLEHLHALLEG